jgi:hypothetical protein
MVRLLLPKLQLSKELQSMYLIHLDLADLADSLTPGELCGEQKRWGREIWGWTPLTRQILLLVSALCH